MKILVDGRSSVHRIANSSIRGESLYIYNLIRVLEKKGNDVTVILPQDLAEVTSTEQKADVLIRWGPWPKDRETDPWKSHPIRRVISLAFNPHPSVIQCWPNEIYAVPSIRHYEVVQKISAPKDMKELPIPMGEFEPPRFDNKRLLWTGKHSLGFAGDVKKWSFLNKWVEAINRLSRTYDCSALMDSPECPGTAYLDAKLDKTVKRFMARPFLKYQQDLRSFSVTWPIDMAGSFLDSLFFGLVPVLCKGAALNYFSDDTLSFCGGHTCIDIPVNEIVRRTELLLNDRASFETTLARIRAGVEKCQDDRVYDQFLRII